MKKNKAIERLNNKTTLFYSKAIFILEIKKKNKKYDIKIL